jgi:hypothetical protein
MKNLKDFERGRAFNFNVKFTKGEPSTIDGDIQCNQASFSHLANILPALMSPSQELIDIFNAKTSSLEGVDPTTNKGAGISTFGYTAAAYGRHSLYVIYYNGQVGQFSM